MPARATRGAAGGGAGSRRSHGATQDAHSGSEWHSRLVLLCTCETGAVENFRRAPLPALWMEPDKSTSKGKWCRTEFRLLCVFVPNCLSLCLCLLESSGLPCTRELESRWHSAGQRASFTLEAPLSGGVQY